MAADPQRKPLDLSSTLELEDLLAEIRHRAAGAQRSQHRLAALLEAVVAVSSNLDLSRVLRLVVESGCTLVEAEYGALGISDHAGHGLSDFITYGLTPEQEARLGDLPTGHGVLGLLLREPHPIAIDDLTAHPASTGVPPGHPPMRSFVGAPVRVRDRLYGNIYLTEKVGGGVFDEDDERVLAALAAAAGIAIENAQLFRQAQQNEAWSTAVAELTRTLLEGQHERSALARMTKRVRELGDADGAAFLAVSQDELHVHSLELRSGTLTPLQPPVVHSERWRVLLRGRAPLLLMSSPSDHHTGELVVDVRDALGLPHAGATVLVPMTVGPVEVGVIALAWVGEHPGATMDALSAVADNMGLAIEAARAQRARSRTTLLEDRDRIARDMHDHVIQRLFATGLSLQTVARHLDDGTLRSKIDTAVDELDTAVKEIRQAIFELHHPVTPSGLGPELEALVEAVADQLGYVPDVSFEGRLSDVPFSLVAEVMAVVREGLANVVRHAQATNAQVTVSTLDELVVSIADNGIGTHPEAARSGLVNLAQRAALRGGTFDVVRREPRGTRIIWCVPLHSSETSPGLA